jgi:hypothetical protein
MKSIYLAARYSRRKELLEYAKTLELRGCKVTSRWLHGNHEIAATEEARGELALEDWTDLLDAQTVICFTEMPGSMYPGRGGRHVEFGMAVQARKQVIVIGKRENVFHCLPIVRQYDTWTDFLIALDKAKGGAL